MNEATKTELIAEATGIIGVAETAAVTSCVHAINIKLISTVDGNPISIPPNFDPSFSDILIVIATYNPPTIKLRTNLKRNKSAKSIL